MIVGHCVRAIALGLLLAAGLASTAEAWDGRRGNFFGGSHFEGPIGEGWQDDDSVAGAAYLETLRESPVSDLQAGVEALGGADVGAAPVTPPAYAIGTVLYELPAGCAGYFETFYNCNSFYLRPSFVNGQTAFVVVNR